VGFSDAEANFYIKEQKDKSFVGVRFKINLHKDDIGALNYIHDNLGVGRVKAMGDDTVTFEITDMGEIGDVIIPIFTENPLLTIKSINFSKFKRVYEMKKSGQHSIEELYALSVDIKEGMNSQLDLNSQEVKAWEATYNQNNKITLYWLLGFIEGEGTFGVKNNSPYFQICQKDCSECTLRLINQFLVDLWDKNIFNYKVVPPISVSLSDTKNKETGVYSFVIQRIDALYYFYLPLFSGLTFRSRKYIDFKLWSIVVLLCKRGYFHSIGGKQLLVLISQNMNDNRYSTSKKIPPLLSKSDVENIFNLEPSIKEDPLNFKPHATLVKGITSTKGNSVDVFRDGVLVEGSPFPSYAEAQRTLGWNPKQVIIGRLIDTEKPF